MERKGQMANLSGTIRTLEEQRDELLGQVDAINRAIAALRGTDRTGRSRQAARVERPPAPAPKPMARKRHFALSEEHKRKLVEGRKRAKEARAAVSHASDTSAAAIAGWKGDEAPRLVKREAEG